MSKPTLTSLSAVDWTTFLSKGFLIQNPHTNTIWGGYGQSESSELCFFHKPFFAQDEIIFPLSHYFQCSQAELFTELASKLATKVSLGEVFTDSNQTMASLNWALELINQDKLQKIVPIGKSSVAIALDHPIVLLLKFAKLNGHLYGMWDEDSAWVGCSPEILLYQKAESFETMALAGTLSKQTGTAEDLLGSQKDLAEHQLVIQDILEKLAPVGRQEIQVGETQAMDYGPIYHLKTPVSFKDAPASYLRNIRRLHPTAALGGYPSQAAWEELKNYEQGIGSSQRQRSFGGVFGLLTPRESWSLVMIRNLLVQQNIAYIYAGCGVIKESSLEQEFQEILNKRNSILDLIYE